METNIWNSIESKWLRIWEQNAIYTSDPNAGQKKFFITVAYPYPNSPQHIGHGRTYTIADVHARYKRLRGFNVLFPMAFHYTGTPILGMAKRVQAGDKELIENFRRIYGISNQDIHTFRDPLHIAKYFHNEIKAGMKEMGYSIDWRREFTTIDPVYKKLISWQFETLKKHGVIEQGSHPVGWCPNDSNPVSQHDTLGDVEPSFTEYSLIKFKLKNENIIIPVATLRPETIFGVTNLWINPNEEYARVLVDDTENWILSRPAAKKLEHLNYSIKITKTFLGKDLIGALVKSPLTNRFVPILPATFVTLDEGSGIVMSVPAHAPFDMQALLDFRKLSRDYPAVLNSEKIVPIVIIDSKAQEPVDLLSSNIDDNKTITNKGGHFTARANQDFDGHELIPARVLLEKYDISNQSDPNLEKATSELYSIEFYKGKMNKGTFEYSGMPVSKAKDLVKDRLIALHESVPFFEMTNKPVYCRCGTLCYVKLLNNQWFLNYGNSEWKNLALECLNRMEVIPSEIIKEFNNVFEWLKVRACARKTGLGTPLPWDKDWIVESLSDSVIYMTYYIIAKYVNLNEFEKFSDIVDNSFFDYVLLNIKSGYFLALDENDNVSKDFSTIESDPNSDKSMLTEFLQVSKLIHEEFKYYYPLDSRHSGRDLVPNHLSFFIFNHAIIFPKSLWPKQIVVNGSVLMDGKKMSKSMGNIIPLRSTIKQFNADSIRVAMLALGELLQDVDFSFSALKGIYSRLNEIYDFGKDLITRQNAGINLKLINDDFSKHLVDLEWEDKWLVHRVNSIIKDMTNSFEELRIRDALNTVLYLMDKDFEWYKKRKESRTSRRSDNNTDLFVISYFFRARIKMLSPFCPFLAEELWELLEPQKGSIFQDGWPSFKNELVNPVTNEIEQEISNILDDLHKILRVTKNTQLKNIHIYLSSNDKKILYGKVLDLVTNSNTKNFGLIMKSLLSDPTLSIDHKNFVKSNTDFIKKINEDILSLSPTEQERRINIGLFDEYTALMDGIGLLISEFGIQETCIKVYYEQDAKIYDPKNKARFSRPFKPAIYLE
ncbi:MAG TPA: leucine--tRNA ligase [Candidatus Nitrosocosmicus sp.]|nr:leucine--tRNA ligase [Candidatus Nitrosocosmicus sp.]